MWWPVTKYKWISVTVMAEVTSACQHSTKFIHLNDHIYLLKQKTERCVQTSCKYQSMKATNNTWRKHYAKTIIRQIYNFIELQCVHS